MGMIKSLMYAGVVAFALDIPLALYSGEMVYAIVDAASIVFLVSEIRRRNRQK